MTSHLLDRGRLLIAERDDLRTVRHHDADLQKTVLQLARPTVRDSQRYQLYGSD
jgi:hypothetical protein